ncbi:hypothetical protein ARAM_002667 [Aspergillus rambellii]|uniref:3-phytase n=1 Tax=Aspergillus rambellii TaxID=308745 RepID=A0A0F8UBG7_9EURO|nr:hypothetical protein ARAM_002667 [Aspergillus rambellii]
MHLLHRHGSRYPTGGEHLEKWGKKIMNAAAENAVFTGKLAFLNHWVYGLGENILVTRGRQELFASGILNFFNYGALYNNQSKLVVRTTTKDRILKSAENFVSGFFGLDWRDNANILAAIEAKGFNTSLMSTNACPNSARSFGKYASAPRDQWKEKYLRHRTKKLRELSGEYDWTVSDSYNAQAVCAYETVSLGYSPFCPLFNYEEWEGFSYASDIWFSAASGFQSPTGRAQGITWVEEFIARVEDRPFNVSGGPTAANLTLNANPVTFPHNQSLYLDFTHDTILVSVLTALGFKQFASFLPASGPPRHHQFRTNTVVPFASRINIEIIRSPHEIRHRRSRHRHADPYIPGTGETHYVHFLLNQRTLPMYSSFKQCGRRDDGWCELSTFLDIQKKSLERAQFEYSCTGDWEIGEYGSVHDGVPAKLL